MSRDYVKKHAHSEAAKAAWKAGWTAGLALTGVLIGVAFGGWFRIGDAIAQGRADAVKDAGSDTDKKLAPLATDIAVLKNDMATVKDDVADIKKAQQESTQEILRLLRKRDGR